MSRTLWGLVVALAGVVLPAAGAGGAWRDAGSPSGPSNSQAQADHRIGGPGVCFELCGRGRNGRCLVDVVFRGLDARGKEIVYFRAQEAEVEEGTVPGRVTIRLRRGSGHVGGSEHWFEECPVEAAVPPWFRVP